MNGKLLTPDRVTLYLTLVPYLVERGEVSLEDAARDFDVTPAQMRTMVEKLTLIGRPEQMPDDLFDINWDLLDEQGIIELTQSVGLERSPRLTAREAAALLGGLRLAGSLPGVATGEVYAGLLAKLSRGASGAPAEVVVVPGPVDEVRALVSQALRDQVALSFTYRRPDSDPTTRTVDPVKVIVTGGQWYLQGWCHMRRAMRNFLLERVSEPRVTDLPIEHAHEPVPELFEPGENDEIAVVRFPDELTPLIADYLSGAESTSSGGTTTVRLRVSDARTLKRLAARRAGRVEILEPASARRAAADWAAEALALYGEDT
ncbi:helix-turn-helix transcriptional regulator [Microbacterium paludicola]|jgi:proteasome accessory factor C|uniref:WYL domain-containing protein n=1 Tax=Microbacterium paludicola TaxID=300019 RepID=A0A4Y9FW04_9MICO|nr:WYL domain-containing protein [Microbacterium paludicola]MBF0816111.1 WYL domain-containing protein [Microbacterium paludicola]TFU33173.1 WYL domain-containing protein [Microbacterium paludicola]